MDKESIELVSVVSVNSVARMDFLSLSAIMEYFFDDCISNVFHFESLFQPKIFQFWCDYIRNGYSSIDLLEDLPFSLLCEVLRGCCVFGTDLLEERVHGLMRLQINAPDSIQHLIKFIRSNPCLTNASSEFVERLLIEHITERTQSVLFSMTELPFPIFCNVFPYIDKVLTPDARSVFLIQSFQYFGSKMFACVSSLELEKLSQVELSFMKRTFSSDKHFCCAVDYCSSLRTRLDEANRAVLEVIVGKDQRKAGHFHCGKLLCDGINTGKDESAGIKLIEKSASSNNKDALEYLIRYYGDGNDANKFMKWSRSLYNLGEKTNTIELIMNYPMLSGAWCKSMFEEVVRDGFLSSESVCDETKASFIGFYVEHVSQDVSAIAGNLSSTYPYLRTLPSNMRRDVTHLILYDYLENLSHKATTETRPCMEACLARLSEFASKVDRRPIYESLLNANAGPEEFVRLLAPVEVIPTNLTESVGQMEDGRIYGNFTVTIVSTSAGVGNSTLSRCLPFDKSMLGIPDSVVATRLPYSIFEKNNKKVAICMWDTKGVERFWQLEILYCRKASCLVVCYRADHKDQVDATLRRYSMLVKEYPLASIIFAETFCDLPANERSDRRISEFCLANGIPHVQTSARTGIGIKELRSAIIDASIMGYIRHICAGHDMNSLVK